MAWFNFFGQNEEKLNPVQPDIGGHTESTREYTLSYEKAYEELEIVNRAVNMLVDDCSQVNFKVNPERHIHPVAAGLRRSKVEKLLNYEPNPFQDINSFRRNLYIDLIIDGNMFIYWDGVHMYHLPASKVTIHASEKTYIEKFTFNEKTDFSPNEIIHVKDNSFYSIYRGVSRLRPALRTMILLKRMRDFQDNFFKNEAVPGLIIKSPNTLSDRIKQKTIASWQQTYNPRTGGGRPLILDGGLDLAKISDVNFKDLDFQTSIAENEKIILKALGIPPILVDSGNNANLRPNLRLYYLETIIPTISKYCMSIERFFGYGICRDVSNIPALQPELRDQAQYYTSLVNAGIITPNEARVSNNFEPIEDEAMNMVRIPANIAGSAVDPSQGGRPVDTPEE